MAITPYVSTKDRLIITPIDSRFTRIELIFGHMEETNLPKALALARRQGIKFDIMSTSFF